MKSRLRSSQYYDLGANKKSRRTGSEDLLIKIKVSLTWFKRRGSETVIKLRFEMIRQDIVAHHRQIHVIWLNTIYTINIPDQVHGQELLAYKGPKTMLTRFVSALIFKQYPHFDKEKDRLEFNIEAVPAKTGIAIDPQRYKVSRESSIKMTKYLLFQGCEIYLTMMFVRVKLSESSLYPDSEDSSFEDSFDQACALSKYRNKYPVVKSQESQFHKQRERELENIIEAKGFDCIPLVSNLSID